MKTRHIKRLMTGIAVSLGLGLSTQALGLGAIAYSWLEVDNFQVFNNTTGNQLTVADFSFLDIGNSSSASAVTSFGPGSATASPSSLSTLMACSGNCGAIAENDPTQQAVTNFGRGDTFGNGGAVIGGLPGPNFVNVWTVAEGRQDATGFTTGISGARTATEFTFRLGGAAGTTTQVRFDFDVLSQIFVQLDQDLVQAIASYSWNVGIIDIATGVQVFSWAPDGAAGGISGGTEIADPFSMNDSHSVLNTGTDGTGVQNGFFQAVATFQNGVDYRFTIGHGSQINTQVAVPEPALLFLLGSGLAGLGVSRRLSKAKKA